MELISKRLRKLVVEALEGGGRGHLGSSMSMIEILHVLYDGYLNISKDNFNSPDRDRFILSKGHGCLALYAVLADKGFIPTEELKTFCKLDSRLGGHPERGKIPGVEASTGALGHGLPIGVGMAIAAKIRKKNYKVVVLTGDGEINEGSVWEAAMSAAKHKLSNLTVMVDYNKLQSYGLTKEVLDLEPLVDKWKSFGFETVEIDGHNIAEIQSTLNKLPFHSHKPSAIICHTVKGKGFPFAEGNANWHHKSKLSKEEIEAMYACL
ncbi:transketolase [Leptospira mayottensis]|uniref:Transketolase, thiamine pyrophosphate-binding domain protein n=2 Tax=Leptospira mayottensis TaxID=1137606 RepID=A0AA87SWB0_9LEPT|nr:transketolase [Leptospira mayottensis]AXR64977.1 transketolase [Leptospira mayottensis]EKR98953.1 transketolase, thiamine pyrophosphate-binding domain protein [Leptospira mayottensis 200901122]